MKHDLKVRDPMMAEFRISNSTAEDLKDYPQFFAMAPLFNTLNMPAYFDDPEPNIISRMTQKSVDRLVFWRDEPIFFVSFRKSIFTNSINTIIFDSRLGVERDKLYQFLRNECFDKAHFLSPHTKFEYYTSDQSLNREILSGIGFRIQKNHRIMNILLDRRSKPITRHFGNLSVQVVQEKQDIQNRVLVQNSVFQNKNRIPLEVADVQKEMKNDSYIPELSMLLAADGRPCGYGQIIRNQAANYLVNFGVIPEYQGLGYSHYLLEALLEGAKTAGLQIVILEVFEENEKAVRLYERHGFKTMYNKCQWVYQQKEQTIRGDF